MTTAEATIEQQDAMRDENQVVPRTDASQDKLVPVTEAKKYRKRAQAAEHDLEHTQAELADVRENLMQVQLRLKALQQQQTIDDALIEAGAVDLDTARLLVQQHMNGQNETGDAGASEGHDVDQLIEDLQRDKPFLFRGKSSKRIVSAPVAADRNGSTATVTTAADTAARTGHRNDVLRYLRLRRTQQN